MDVEEQNFSENLENLSETGSNEKKIDKPEEPQEGEDLQEGENLQNEGREDAAQENEDKKGGSESYSKEPNRKQLYESFLVDLEKMEVPEEKLKLVIDFMSSALATKQGAPYFKGFWDARTLALQLFKENLNPAIRSELWSKYSELSKEARRLKETLDEQSAFAAEQIEIAIKAIENEQENPELALEAPSDSDLIHQSQALQDHLEYYQNTQRELNLLNTHASRITALRKELIRIEMRVRQKNKFFQRLSSLGDKTFPRRKDLIKELSQQFIADMDHFTAQYFSSENFNQSIFFLREEIKILQAVAKYLTLNTQAFTYTRMRLSECWDKLKNTDKERKRQRAQSRAVYKENADKIFGALSEIESNIQKEALNLEEVNNQLDEISREMRQIELGKEEIKAIKDKMAAMRHPLVEKARVEEQQRIQELQERDKQKKLKIQEVKSEISSVIETLENYSADQLSEKKEELSARISELTATKTEKQDLERQLKAIKEAIIEKKENAILALSEDDRQAVEQLREVLQQRTERRQEIKKQLEQLRKGSGLSGLDFEQAMNYNLRVTAEKERLEKVSEGIKEIEAKIAGHLKKKAD